MRQRRHHTAVSVRVGQRRAQIDKKIAPLIREIWRADIDTNMSCEGGESGLVWIDFPGERELVRFLNTIARYESGKQSLYARMYPRYRVTENAWSYEIFENDLALDDAGEEERHDGRSDFYFTFSVRFPHADLPEVVRRLREHNRISRVAKRSKDR